MVGFTDFLVILPPLFFWWLVIRCGTNRRFVLEAEELLKLCKIFPIKYIFPPLWLDDMQDVLAGASTFLNIDLRSGCQQIRIQPGDERNNFFKKRDSFYEWLVMLLAYQRPQTFMRMTNQILPFLKVSSCLFCLYSDLQFEHLERLIILAFCVTKNLRSMRHLLDHHVIRFLVLYVALNQ